MHTCLVRPRGPPGSAVLRHASVAVAGDEAPRIPRVIALPVSPRPVFPTTTHPLRIEDKARACCGPVGGTTAERTMTTSLLLCRLLSRLSRACTTRDRPGSASSFGRQGFVRAGAAQRRSPPHPFKRRRTPGRRGDGHVGRDQLRERRARGGHAGLHPPHPPGRQRGAAHRAGPPPHPRRRRGAGLRAPPAPHRAPGRGGAQPGERDGEGVHQRAHLHHARGGNHEPHAARVHQRILHAIRRPRPLPPGPCRTPP